MQRNHVYPFMLAVPCWLNVSHSIHHRDRKINPKVHMEAQITSNGQSNPEQKEQHGSYHNT
jgi:hypothetical protein